MQSNGGIMTADFLAKRAVASLGSGPTGGVMGACAVAKQAGVADFIAIDMGGTSYEACLINGGTPRDPSFWNWQHRYLVGLPMVEMHSIGAGGGSIAFVQAGALRVGPESAKADPGPICYGRGGTAPDRDRRQPGARLHQPRGALRRRVQAAPRRACARRSSSRSGSRSVSTWSRRPTASSGS